MTMLLIGLGLFIGIHCTPLSSTIHHGLVAKLGEKRFKAIFSLLALLGIILMTWGMSIAPFEQVYTPPTWGRMAAIAAMPVALILFVAANFACHIRRLSRHPMMIGTLLWASAHLTANGDLASVLLFGSFAVWSVLVMIASKKPASNATPNVRNDVISVVVGVAAYVLLAKGHGWLFGVPLV